MKQIGDNSKYTGNGNKMFEGIAQDRFCTYNILSQNLASHSHFSACDPDDLDTGTRVSRIKEILSSDIKDDSIIALQEVSTYFSKELHPYFNKNNYYFVNNNYGSKFNDYMGVGIAIPLSKYEIIDMDSKRIGDKIKLSKEMNKLYYLNFICFGFISFINKLIQFYLRTFKFLFSWFGIKYNSYGKDSWNYSMNRFNSMISLKVRNKHSKKSFWISTYHMPCAFNNPDVMVIHSSLVLQHLQSLAREDNEETNTPYVLLGDFNFKPTDSMYELYTKGFLEKNHPDYPEDDKELFCNYKSNINLMVDPVRSAYKEITGSEPPYTNNAKVNGKEQFIECIDYIFVSNEWNIKQAIEIKELEDNKPFPNKINPSDHVPVRVVCDLSS